MSERKQEGIRAGNLCSVLFVFWGCAERLMRSSARMSEEFAVWNSARKSTRNLPANSLV